MTFFMQLREQIRKLIRTHEGWVEKVFKGVLTLIALRVIAGSFGYSDVLSQQWLQLVVSVLCAFVPMSALALVVEVFLVLELLSMSRMVALVAAIFFAVSYALCGVYHGRDYQNLPGITVTYQLHVPYLLPLESGLLGKVNDVTTVICGATVSYYLKSIKDHASQILDSKDSISVLDLLTEGLVTNVMFYVYLTALVVMFLLVYAIRNLNIAHSWLIATAVGVVSEFVILLSGYLLTSRTSQIPWLIGGNLIVLIIGFATNYLVLDLDYNRAQRVQFEDDEYYYYVTAVPKIRLADETKEVIKITSDRRTALGRRVASEKESQVVKRSSVEKRTPAGKRTAAEKRSTTNKKTRKGGKDS